jgi:hypothetical protein
MISDTKNPEEKGFIKLFLVIVVVVAVLIYFGLNPKGIWENILLPIVEFGFGVFLKIVGFFFDIAIWVVNRIGF